MTVAECCTDEAKAIHSLTASEAPSQNVALANNTQQMHHERSIVTVEHLSLLLELSNSQTCAWCFLILLSSVLKVVQESNRVSCEVPFPH